MTNAMSRVQRIFTSGAIARVAASMLVLGASAAGGCSLIASRPGSTQWTIDAVASVPSSEGAPVLTQLGVARPRMAAPWNSDTLVYHHANGEARADIYNGWVMPIDQILQSQMVDVLAQAKAAQSVTTAGLFGTDQFALVSSVRSFGAFYDEGAAGVARVKLQVLLLQRTNEDPRMLMDRLYEHEVPVASDDAAGVVKGLSDAYGQCLRDLVRDLRAIQAEAIAKP
jgi:ABC-type uncharacterized transport system auxiliary subunit